jgi:DNA-binding transcriptional LysR family regulator
MQAMPSSWDDLRFLLASHREGSLARAGQTLGVDATTVGRRITTLEKQLGSKLIERVPDGVRLTDAGVLISRLAEELEHKLAVVSRQVAGARDQVEGRVRVTAGDGFAPLLVKVMGRLRRLHPGLELELVLDRRVHDLVRGEADVALRTVRPKEGSLAARRLGSLAFGLFASHDYLRRAGRPRTVSALERHALIGLDASLATAPEMRWLKARGITRFALRTNHAAALLEAACAGLGIAPMARAAAQLRPELEAVLPDEQVAKLPLWLVFRATERSAPKLRAVASALLAELQEAEGLLRTGQTNSHR